MDAVRDCAILPCAHVCVCSGCAPQLLASAAADGACAKCPVCRNPFQTVFRLYF
jgi:hypothetical protein